MTRQEDVKADRKRLRGAILAQLGQRAMTFNELAAEVDHIAPINQVKRELRALTGRDLVCSTYSGKANEDLFETWESVAKRLRAKKKARGETVKPRARRPSERIA